MAKLDKKRRLHEVCMACLLVALASVVSADQKDEYQAEIATIAKEIRQISRNMNANKALLKTEQDKLAELEQQIVQTRQRQAQTRDELQKQEAANEELEAQLALLNEDHAEDKRVLAMLVREKYIKGETNYLKMMLNQENPYAVGRLANYYTFFAEAQLVKMTEIRAKLAETQRLAAAKQSNLEEIRQQQQKLDAHQQTLVKTQGQRQQTVARLNRKVSQTNEKLTQLNKDRDRLNQLLQAIAIQAERLRKLEQQRQTAPSQSEQQTRVERPLVAGGFKKQKGRLKCPVTGRKKYNYGSRIAESGMRAQGMFFETQGTQPIRSIYRGRVLFADYLKGYGLLLIVDHGDDHISLYGHNELLYKKVGDVVDTNELIAQSGVSGGLKSHGLYFEIRRNTTPVDPASWCY
ncbi:MAG: peptidoglycan DD-metalloendopeptidase family protein [Pseudomonadota bacterium]